MLPLSFKEFLTFYEFEPPVPLEDKFQRYLRFGRMPILREYRFNEPRCSRDADRRHILENIVFLELIRRDYHVYIGKVSETEVDFVTEKMKGKLYIQDTESMLSPETR